MEKKEKLKGICIYRVSTEGQVNKSSIGDIDGKERGFDRQKEDCKKVCDANNIEVVENGEYSIVESGNLISETKEFKEILSRFNEIDCIVVNNLDRLLRPEDFTSFLVLQGLKDNDIQIFTSNGLADLNTEFGYLMSIIQSTMNGLEIGKIKARMMGGKNRIKNAGGHAGGKGMLPYGVGYFHAPKNSAEKSKFYYIKECDANLETIFKGIEQNKPYAQISKETGLPRSSIKGIATNKIWIGYREYKYERTGKWVIKPGVKKYKRKVALKKPLLVKAVGIDDPKLTVDRFNNICDLVRRRENSELHSREYAKSFIYNGVAKCGVCGLPLYAHQKPRAIQYFDTKKQGMRTIKSNNDYYVCASSSYSYRQKQELAGRVAVKKCGAKWQNKLEMERVIDCFLEEEITTWDIFCQMKKVTAEPATSFSPINMLEKQIANKRKNIDKKDEDYKHDLIDVSDWKLFKEQLTRELVCLEQELEDAKRTDVETVNLNHVFPVLVVALNNLKQMEPLKKKAIVKKMVRDISVKELKIIGFTLNPINRETVLELLGTVGKLYYEDLMCFIDKHGLKFQGMPKSEFKDMLKLIKLLPRKHRGSSDDNRPRAAAEELPERFC